MDSFLKYDCSPFLASNFCYNYNKIKSKFMNKLIYIWNGFKNAFNEQKTSTRDLWDIKSNLENKLKNIDYETYKKINSKFRQQY